MENDRCSRKNETNRTFDKLKISCIVYQGKEKDEANDEAKAKNRV